MSPSASPSASPAASVSPSASASVSASPDPVVQGRYLALGSPTRVLDSRNGTGTSRGLKSGPVVLDLSGVVPAGATGVVLNVTVTNPTGRGFAVVYPDGISQPATSNVNFQAGQTQANEVLVKVPASRRVVVDVFEGVSANVIADLVGYFTDSTADGDGQVRTQQPVRAFDSRETGTPLRSGEVVVDLTGKIPAGSTSAVLNVTVTRPTARGFVVAYPTGTTRPGTSNVNFETGETRANEVFTLLGTGANAGKVSLFVDSASAAVIVDVVGSVGPQPTTSNAPGGGNVIALDVPVRALDTRQSRGPQRVSGAITVTLPGSVPADATGVVLNVTAVNGTRPGFVTVFPTGTTRPNTSNVNFLFNVAQANEVLTGIGTGRQVTLVVDGGGNPAAHLIVDIAGYLKP